MAVEISDDNRSRIGKEIGDCRTFDERKRVRNKWVELLGCSHQLVSATGIWYCLGNFLPKDEDVDEWWEKRGEYSSDVKCGYRGKIKEFLRKSLVGRDVSKLKLVCLPGVHCWEIEDYLDLGFLPENIWGIERVRRDFELMQYKASQYRINTVRSSLTRFFERTDVVFDVVVMDYKGQLCEGYLSDVNIVEMPEDGILITNFWCRRELGPIQNELDFIYRDMKARRLADKLPKTTFINLETLSSELSVPTLSQSRAAIAGLVYGRVLRKFNCDYDEFMSSVKKVEYWDAKRLKNPIYQYVYNVMRGFHYIDDIDHIDECVDLAVRGVLYSLYGFNFHSGFESFDYRSPTGSDFYTTMICMRGATDRYSRHSKLFADQLLKFISGSGNFKINGDNLLYFDEFDNYSWDMESFADVVEDACSYCSDVRTPLSDLNKLFAIEVDDNELVAEYNSIGDHSYNKFKNDLRRKERKDRKKLLSRKLCKK